MKKFFKFIVLWWAGFVTWIKFLLNSDSKDDFANADFPVVDICGGNHTSVSPTVTLRAPRTPWEDFKNKITWYPLEEDAFAEWKSKYYPEATATTIEDYRKNYKNYRYQSWACRVLNVKPLPHDPGFPVMYCIVDVEREVDSNRLSDDIRHWYIDFVKANYDASEIENADKEHVRLSGKPNAHWENNTNPTRKTIK